MAWQPPQQVGDRALSVKLAKGKLRKYSYGQGLGDTDEYTEAFADALLQFQAIVHAEVVDGKRAGPDVNTDGVLDWATQKQLGTIAPPAPPPPKPRHAALVYRGTGGIVGQDYVSRVCQGAADLVEEINPDYPASMGGLPPGAPGTPSARIAINTGFESGCRWIEQNPTRTFVLGGYSLGEIIAAMLVDALLTPGGRLYQHRDRFVASFHIGPPARPLGGAFYQGAAAPGVGISSWRLPQQYAADPRLCWLCHPGDMYGSIPVPIDGGTGDLMETVFDAVTDAGLSDFLGTVQRMIPHLLEMLKDTGVLPVIGVGATALPGVLGGLGGLAAGNPAAMLGPALGLVPVILPLLVGLLPGLIAGVGGSGAGGNLTGPAAATQAAIIGMRFLLSGTRDHISYHVAEVWPGQTYLGLAVQHVRDWAARVPVRA